MPRSFGGLEDLLPEMSKTLDALRWEYRARPRNATLAPREGGKIVARRKSVVYQVGCRR
jgi:hypothetical protein